MSLCLCVSVLSHRDAVILLCDWWSLTLPIMSLGHVRGHVSRLWTLCSEHPGVEAIILRADHRVITGLFSLVESVRCTPQE